MKKIDYKNSLLALIGSVLAYYGAGPRHGTLSVLDRLLTKKYKNLVVMLFDGMGTAILEKHLPEDAFLRKNMLSTLSSVFPPTTTAATITMESGLSPVEHGWLGWSLYFHEVGRNVNIFPNTISGSGGSPAAGYHMAGRHLPYETVFDRIKAATSGETGAYCVSPFSDYKSRDLRDIIETVKSLCAHKGRRYVYTYWTQPDLDMHELGTGDTRIASLLEEINGSVENMCASLSDTLLIVTADHGLTDTRWRFISDYPQIAACLERAPSIETRASAFFVKNGMGPQFEQSFREAFGDSYILLSREQVLSEKLFGDGEPNPRAYGMLGDYLAIATGPVSIDYQRQNRELFRAAHAGLTDEEINIPFIAVELP